MSDGSESGWLVAGSTDPDEIAERYDDWAEGYDDDLSAWGYSAPDTAAELLLDRHPQIRVVLDAGCGTGLVGRALRSTGFTGAIHGLDVSDSSLRRARDTGVYTTLETVDLQQPLGVAADHVDAVVCVGVMTYLPDVEVVWREFARVTRPGGLVIVTQREDLWEPRGCGAVLEALTADGTWSDVEVIGPSPYLPGNTEGMAPIGVYHVVARVP